MDRGQFDTLARLVSHQQSRRSAIAIIFRAALAGVVAPFLPGGDADAKRGRGPRSNRDKGNGKAKRGPDGRGKRGKRRGDQLRSAAACFSGSPCLPGPAANLGKCDFAVGQFQGANLSRSNLKGANLFGAALTGATLSKANLDGACLVDADLTDANMKGSFTGNAIFCRTTMPNASTNNSGCSRGTTCCPTCDAAHPCPNGQVCCAGTCVSGACCNANDCTARTCQTKTCIGRQCVYSPISGTTGPGCTTLCCNGSCVPTSALCGGICDNICTPGQTCCGDKCVPTTALCGGICANVCQAGEICCGEKCTPTRLLCGGNCQNICPGGLTCCGEGRCQQCCGSDTSTCKPAGACGQVNCENGVCTYTTDKDGTPCEAGKGTCCKGVCVPTDTLCGGMCGNVCAAPSPNCCGQSCRACCTDSHCTNPNAPFCLGFQCVDQQVVSTFARVRTVVSNVLGVDEDKITMESEFGRDLGADSLDAVELIIALEDEFGIAISDEDAENIDTVGDAVQYIIAHGG